MDHTHSEFQRHEFGFHLSGHLSHYHTKPIDLVENKEVRDSPQVTSKQDEQEVMQQTKNLSINTL